MEDTMGRRLVVVLVLGLAAYTLVASGASVGTAQEDEPTESRLPEGVTAEPVGDGSYVFSDVEVGLSVSHVQIAPGVDIPEDFYPEGTMIGVEAGTIVLRAVEGTNTVAQGHGEGISSTDGQEVCTGQDRCELPFDVPIRLRPGNFVFLHLATYDVQNTGAVEARLLVAVVDTAPAAEELAPGEPRELGTPGAEGGPLPAWPPK
jgi:hypothetical protein